MTPVHRRDVLAAIGVAGTRSLVTGNRASGGGDVADEGLSVRIYPGPFPAWGWLGYGLDGFTSGWPPPHRAARAAVETALASIDGPSVGVRGGRPIQRADIGIGLSPSREDLLEAFQRVVQDRGVETGRTCHLLLWWGPLDWSVGYGAAQGHVGDGNTHSVCNVGATERWDGRSVTRNMAIHETLHAFLSDAVVSEVADVSCDHDLGALEWVDGRTVAVSPMATAYGLPDRIGLGTRWPGTGCVDRERFDQVLGGRTPERVRYSTTLSDATRAAVTAFLDRSD